MSGIPALGIDFGTSNCAAAVAEKGVPRLLALDGEECLLPSVLYVDRAVATPVEIDPLELARRVVRAKTDDNRRVEEALIKKLKYERQSESELVARAKSVLIREAQVIPPFVTGIRSGTLSCGHRQLLPRCRRPPPYWGGFGLPGECWLMAVANWSTHAIRC